MDASRAVSLEAAAESEAPLLANLLELYSHDLSAVFPNIQIGTDGRFGYHRLPLYWTEPGRRFPFLIRVAGVLAGFALVVRGSPASEEPEVFDIAEFFVLRKQRRAGVGRHAARLLWQRLPGRWTVRVSEGNLGAISFWEATIAEYSGGRAIRTARPGPPSSWRVFDFESAPENRS